MRISIVNYFKAAFSVWDVFSLCLLRLARTRPFGHGGLISSLLKRLYPQLKFRPEVMKGLTVIVDPSDITHLKITDEFLFDQVYDLSKLPFTPDYIIDCGGHIGLFSLLCSGYFTKKIPVTLFEPNPKNIYWIHKHIEVNQLQQINVIEAAVSTYEGEASFDIQASSFGGKLIADPGNIGYKVKVVNLIPFLPKNKESKLLLKMDIEGEEVQLLPKILDELPDCTFIFLETHHGIDACKELTRMLEARQFSVTITRITDGMFIDLSASRFKA